MTSWWGSPGFQEGGEEEVGLDQRQGLVEGEEEEAVQETQRCCLGEVEGILEIATAGRPLAAILV